jgi:hypothetical protein
VKRTYPLEPVETLRGARADARAREVSEAERRLREARAEAQLACEALEKARAARQATESKERERLETGTARALDMEQSFLHSERGRMQERELEARRSLVARRADDVARMRESALASLATAHAELSAVERHHSQWSATRERELQEKEQEAAMEQWNSERSRRSGR